MIRKTAIQSVVCAGCQQIPETRWKIINDDIAECWVICGICEIDSIKKPTLWEAALEWNDMMKFVQEEIAEDLRYE